MRQIALSIVMCLASYGCAASEESEPPLSNGGSGSGGSPAAGGSTPVGTGGSTPVGTGGSAGSTPVGTGGTGGAPPAAGGTPPTTGGTGVSAAGSTGTGGTPPAAGACTATATATGTPPLIDDLEDGNADIPINDGRAGGWYLSTDTTGTTTPAAGAATPTDGGMPGKAIHVTGSGLTGWGASLAASITPKDACYNASMFTGITVNMKGTGTVWVSVLTAAVRGAPVGMQNHYKKLVTLSTDWQPVSISFTELTQPGGWGTIVPFDATKIYGIDFGPATVTGMPTSFDFWVDNLSFK